MKITVERHADGSVTVHIDRQPLPEARFKAVCALAAAGVYAGLVIATAALCGVPGLAAIGFITVFSGIAISGARL